MSFLRVLLLGLLAFVLLVLALANREIVTLRLFPGDLASYLGLRVDVNMPLFLVILLSVAIGLLIGFTVEWFREHKHRADARAERAQKERLEAQLARTRARQSEEDEVLALLDEPR